MGHPRQTVKATAVRELADRLGFVAASERLGFGADALALWLTRDQAPVRQEQAAKLWLEALPDPFAKGLPAPEAVTHEYIVRVVGMTETATFEGMCNLLGYEFERM